jgi:uncharacterized membrane protein
MKFPDFGFNIDFTRLAALLRIRLPPRWVIFLCAFIIVVFPILVIVQAFKLRSYGDSQTLFWIALIYTLVIAVIYVLIGLEVQKLADRFHLRK